MQKAQEIEQETGIRVNYENNYTVKGGDNGVLWPIPDPCAKYSKGVVYNGKLASSI